MGDIRIVAHRGASRERPENTLEAFDRAAEMGAQWVELDARVTRDGVPVVLHDKTLRLVGRRVRADIRRVDSTEVLARTTGGAVVPTLQSALQAMEHRQVGVYVEIKAIGEADIEAIVRVVMASQTPIVISSFQPATLDLVKQRGAFRRMALFSDRIRPADIRRCERSDIEEVGCHRRWADADAIALARRANLRLLFYTVNRRTEMKRLLQLGCDGFFTDDPTLGLQAVQQDTPAPGMG